MKKQATPGKKLSGTPKSASNASGEEPKRKVGRPRKTEVSSRNEIAALRGVKSEAAKKNRLAAKKAGTSTRDLIIASANEIINRTGVVDFRIETLAQSLSLSPGNITYHFPKKEDIIAAIWEEYLIVMNDLGRDLITPLLDIKQIFLFYRNAFTKAISYGGVTTYYFGDMGALLRENELYLIQQKGSRELAFETFRMLQKNGYLKKIEDRHLEEMIFDSQHVLFRWWLNHAMTKVQPDELITVVDRYVAFSLLQLLPFLTEAGKQQFESISYLIK